MTESLKGEILGDDVAVPPVHDVTPGWIGRNRTAIETGRNVTRALMVLAPPPARVALGVASVTADALLLADDYGRRRGDLKDGAVTGAALALEGIALMAMTRFAPARLAANIAGIEALRSALAKVAPRPGNS
jgi:hypothetical protein